MGQAPIVSRMNPTIEQAILEQPANSRFHSLAKEQTVLSCKTAVATSSLSETLRSFGHSRYFAREIAGGAAQIQKSFPQFKVGNIEPFGQLSATPMGCRYGCMTKSTPRGCRDQSLAGAHGIPFDVIINSGQPDGTDHKWIIYTKQPLEAAQILFGRTITSATRPSVFNRKSPRFLQDTDQDVFTDLIELYQY